MRFFRDERGFVATFMMGMWFILLVCGMLVLMVFAVAIWKSADYSYEEIGSALKFAVYAADYNGALQSEGQITPGEVTPYFDYAFAKDTNTTHNGNEFVGGPYVSPVELTGLYSVQPGEIVNGSRALEPGFEVYMEVPIFPGGVFGLKSMTVTMAQFAVSESVAAQ